MLTPEQIERAEQMLGEGMTADRVATELGFETRSQLSYRLLQSGKRIRTIRILEDIVPVEAGGQRRETVTA